MLQQDLLCAFVLGWERIEESQFLGNVSLGGVVSCIDQVEVVQHALSCLSFVLQQLVLLHD